MPRAILTIAHYTLLEALRNRLLWLLAALALGALGLSAFLRGLALTESAALQAAVLAAVLRLAAVFLVATFVTTGMAREAHDKGQELLLALALPRAAYLLGKLTGFGALAVLPASLFGLLGMLWAPPDQAALWAATLLCELWIVAAFSLLCVLTLQQVVPALAAALSFYLLARVAGTLQLLAHGPTVARDTLQLLLGRAIDVLAALLPGLDHYSRSEWLLYHTGGAADLLAIAAQTAIYVSLLTGAALFDLYRRNL